MGSWDICSLRIFCFALCCCCFFLVIEVIGFRCSSLSHFFPFDSVLKYKSSLKMIMHTKPQNIKLPKLKTYNKQNLTSRNWIEQKSVRYVSIYQYTTFISNQQQILLSPPFIFKNLFSRSFHFPYIYWYSTDAVTKILKILRRNLDKQKYFI